MNKRNRENLKNEILISRSLAVLMESDIENLTCAELFNKGYRMVYVVNKHGKYTGKAIAANTFQLSVPAVEQISQIEPIVIDFPIDEEHKEALSKALSAAASSWEKEFYEVPIVHSGGGIGRMCSHGKHSNTKCISP